MPISSEMSKDKTKSRTEILCDQVDDLIAQAQSQVKSFTRVKEDLEFEPGLLKKAISMKLGSPEDIQQVANEMKVWKTEVKHDVRAAVMGKKNELKLARKARKKNLQETVAEQRPATRRKKRRGGFI